LPLGGHSNSIVNKNCKLFTQNSLNAYKNIKKYWKKVEKMLEIGLKKCLLGVGTLGKCECVLSFRRA
jgi:hypothetical protein